MRKSPTRLRRIFGGGLGAVSEFLELGALPCFFSFTGRCDSAEVFSDASIFSLLFFCLNPVGTSAFAISSPGLVWRYVEVIFQIFNIYPDGAKTMIS